MAGMRAARARRTSAFRWVVVAASGVFFLLPLFAMLEFTTRKPGGGRTAATWAELADVQKIQTDYPELWAGLKASGGMVVLTVVIMLVLLVPTMTWVRLRLPQLSRTLEFVCLLPLTIPPIVLVVGLAPVYAWVSYLLSESSVWLSFAYVVRVRPYAYRALDAGLSSIDVRTLSEAARSLGAGWFTVMVRIVLPNIRSAVISASFLSVALVLGEFTFASLLNRDNLQVGINLLGKRDPQISIAVALAALVAAFVLLLVLSLAGSRRGSRRRPAAPSPSPTPSPTETAPATTATTTPAAAEEPA